MSDSDETILRWLQGALRYECKLPRELSREELAHFTSFPFPERRGSYVREDADANGEIRFTPQALGLLGLPEERDPQAFRDFLEKYNTFVRCDWHAPNLKELLRDFEAFMSKHPEVYRNKHLVPCINNARGHCKAAGVPFRF